MRCGILLCSIVVIVIAAPAMAIDYFWNNPNGGAFDEPSHWTPFSPPATQGPGGASDTVNFDLGVLASTPYSVSDLGRETSQLIVHNDSVLLSIFVNQVLSSAGAADPSVIVGASSGDDAFATFFSGGVSVLDTQVVRIANVANSEGSVRIDSLEWNSDNFRVGYAGDGILSMDTDATLNSTNGSLAHLTGSTGYAVVQGDWNIAGSFIVGRQGEATLELSAGGSIISSSVVFGDQSNGVGNATVTATLTAAGALTVGNSGDGTLNITSSFGNVSSTNAFVGRLAGSNGAVTVSNGIWNVGGRLTIGGDADAATSGGDGLVEITGGAVAVAQDVTIFPNGGVSLENGSLDAPIVDVQSGAVFDWTGGQFSVDTFDGNLANNGGVLSARQGSNSMLVTGEYSQGPAGVMSIGIDGDAASGDFDSLTVGNTAFLGGVLHVELAEGFQPSPGEVYVVLDALNLGAGSFSNAANGERLFLDLSAGSFLINYGAGSPFDPSQVVLSDFQPAATGDFDNDGDVDGGDFLIWQRGESSNPLSASDLAVWQTNYGAAPLTALSIAVPEPYGMFLVLLLAATLMSRRVSALSLAS
jgi:T5SS/PEP-CTERM-associated repeat protein